MRKIYFITALLITQALVSCDSNSSLPANNLTPSVPAGDLSSLAFFQYGNYISLYTHDISRRVCTIDETFTSRATVSHQTKDSIFYNNDFMESLIQINETFSGNPMLQLDTKEQTYILNDRIHFIHDEGNPNRNYRVSIINNYENYLKAYDIGFSPSFFSFFSEHGKSYPESQLLRSGISHENGASLYVSFFERETSSDYGYSLDLQANIVGNYIISAIISQRYFSHSDLIYSYSEEAVYEHSPKVDFPDSNDILQYPDYPQLEN